MQHRLAPAPPSRPPVDLIFQAGGELARLCRDKDWSSTPLGPVEKWPPSLRAAASLVVAAPAPLVVLWGPELVQIYNDGYRDMMGKKHPAGLGQATRECWPEVWAFNAPLYDGVVQRRETFTFENQRLVIERHGHPEEAFFTLTYSPVAGDGDGVGGVLVTVRETTAEVERARAEERLQLALEAADLGTWSLDLTTDTTPVRSLRHDQIFGYEEMQPAWGMQIALRHVLPEDRPRFEQAFERAATTGVLTAEVRVRWPDGSIHWIEAVGRIYHDAEGRPTQMSGIVGDITERRQTQALRESEARYRSLFESIGQGFCVIEVLLDAQGRPADYRFVETNPAFRRHTGLEGADGKTAREVVAELEDRWIEIYGDIALTGQSRRFVEHSQAMGRWFEVEAFRVGKPQAHRVAILFTDITERKRVEDVLRENDRRKDEFLAMLAHELRNPLAAISNTVGVLERRSPAPDSRRYLEMLQRQAGMLRGLVNDLLDVSRITRGLVELKRERVDLAAVAERALESVQALMDEKRHDVRVTLPREPLPVDGDPVRLEQIVVNLLTNAAKYTDPDGRIALGLERRDAWVALHVRDRGIGMTREVRDRIFDLFGQAERGLARSQGGLGIGLTIVKNLVELHGGRIDAHSAGTGQGSEFIVTLPLAAQAAAAPGTDTPSGPAPAASPAGKRVLVVDDNADIAETLALLLEMAGHRVAVANDGERALAQAEALQPDVVLLDIGLPGMDGYEVARRLRQNPRTQGAVLAALTGYGQLRDREQASAAGFDHHFTKPVDVAVMEAFVNEAKRAVR